jgi:hypothetical protein
MWQSSNNRHTIQNATQDQSRIAVKKMASESGPSPCNRLSQPPPVTLKSRSSWLLLGRCSRQLRKSCAGANMVYSRAERVLILQHYFASKSLVAVRETFAYSDKEMPYETRIHQLWIKFLDMGRFCDRKNVPRRTVLTGKTLVTLKKHSEQQLYCESFLVSALLGIVFGHRNLSRPYLARRPSVRTSQRKSLFK